MVNLLKTIFWGTSELTIPFLEIVYNTVHLIGVVTQPDKSAGRGLKLHPSGVKLWCLTHPELKLWQPQKLIDDRFLAELNTVKPDIGIIVNYGKLLSKTVLEMFRLGCVNIHFSLLPKYRGAAPIQWAIINGETETGVTSFWLDSDMDTGDIIIQQKTNIVDDDTAETLTKRLVVLGTGVLKTTLEDIMNNKITKVKQSGDSRPAPLLTKDNGRINWTNSSRQIHNLIRGTQPWPGAFTFLETETSVIQKLIKIFPGEVVAEGKQNPTPGLVKEVVNNKGVVVLCGTGEYLVLKIQTPGKTPVSAWSFWQGARLNLPIKLG